MVSRSKKMALALVAAGVVVASTVLAGEAALTEESARQAALAQVAGGRVVRSEIEHRRGGRTVFEYVIVDDENRYKIEIDGSTGDIREYSRRPIRPGDHRGGRLMEDGGGLISLDEAQRIALDRTGGGEVVEAKLKNKRRGRSRYEFEIIHNGYEYEVTIDARSGDVMEFEQDRWDD